MGASNVLATRLGTECEPRLEAKVDVRSTDYKGFRQRCTEGETVGERTDSTKRAAHDNGTRLRVRMADFEHNLSLTELSAGVSPPSRLGPRGTALSCENVT